MGRGIDSYIKEQFGIAEVDIRTYSPLTLAYIGDGIYDLVIRSVVVGKGNTRAGELHKRTSQIVKAHTQAEMMEVLLPLLTEEEADIYRRGRNAKSPTMAKNAIGVMHPLCGIQRDGNRKERLRVREAGASAAGRGSRRRKYRASAIGRGCCRQQKESAGSREKRRIHGIRGIKNRGTQCGA